MRILVIGGMHGNEPLGLAVVKLFQEKPVKNVAMVFANEQAIAQNLRFTGQDLNRSFPGGSKAKLYESKRAAQLLRLAKQYDIVLDFHNTHCPENDCGFVGVTAEKSTYDVAWALGLDKIIVADYECINKYAPNCLSVEISLDSLWNDPAVWYERIATLGRLDGFLVNANFQRYRFVYRMTQEDKAKLDLPNQDLRAFQKISPQLARAMGVKMPAYPIFIGDGYTPYNYGGLLNKIN